MSTAKRGATKRAARKAKPSPKKAKATPSRQRKATIPRTGAHRGTRQGEAAGIEDLCWFDQSGIVFLSLCGGRLQELRDHDQAAALLGLHPGYENEELFALAKQKLKRASLVEASVETELDRFHSWIAVFPGTARAWLFASGDSAPDHFVNEEVEAPRTLRAARELLVSPFSGMGWEYDAPNPEAFAFDESGWFDA